MSSTARFHYAAVGEARFVDEYRERLRAALREDPWRYARNIVNRALAVSVRHPDQGARNSPAKLMARRVIYVVPVLGLLLTFLLRKQRTSLALGLSVLWASYLAPYVGVAFYLRYLVPLTPCLMLLAFLGFEQLACAVSKQTATPRASELQDDIVGPS